MTPRVFPGGWYVDAWPNGGPFAVLLLGQGVVQTAQGPLRYEHAPLYTCCTPARGFQIAGQAADAFGTSHYHDGVWHLDPRIAHGNFGCLFDNDGELHILEPAPDQTSQGFRDVAPDGSLVRGDDAMLRDGVSAYVDLGDGVLVGQGHESGGVVVRIDGVLRQLHNGECYAVRAHRAGDAVTISFYDVAEEGLTAFIYDTTLGALRTLPAVTVSSTTVPKSGTPPAPTPLPQPKPEPSPVSEPLAPNKLVALKAIADAHPEINRTVDGPFAPNRGGITQIAASTFGAPWGRKSRDKSLTNLSDDALCYQLPDHRFEIYDILSGTDGAVQFDYKGTFADGENGFFVSIAPPAGGTATSPPQGNPGTPGAQLDSVIDNLHAQLTAALARITALEARPQVAPAEAPVVSIDGVRVALQADGGKFVSADLERGASRPLVADRDAPAGWETFTLRVQP